MNHVEQNRLTSEEKNGVPWKKWGPYLSERQWGTVREDYSESGNAWDSFPHDQSRSRAYRWGEDGLAGFSDDKQLLCFALALWNGQDPILKERLFGLTNSEGNHGEDVKEYYYYLDSTPTHSYMKYLYKYPQQAYPYDNIVASNRYRNRTEMEYELIDTGVFNDDRYFDVYVEYAKASPEDIFIKLSVHNRGSDDATIHLLPTVWFRNTWSYVPGAQKPHLQAIPDAGNSSVVQCDHDRLGTKFFYCDDKPTLLFTENETNERRLIGRPNKSPYVKDGINNYVVANDQEAVNPQQYGTKASAHYVITVPASGVQVLSFRLTDVSPQMLAEQDPLAELRDQVFESRLQDADEFYKSVIPDGLSSDRALIVRQSLSGMLWSKQYYSFDGIKWLREHGYDPIRPNPNRVRNKEWFHMINDDVISMPDKWEYPWYAAWDLAFHTLGLATVDMAFAKRQLILMLGTLYQHPNGQIPAYEWNFNDVNPPVHAWAALYLYRMEQDQKGEGDINFLKSIFSKLTTNFTWWVNRKDRFGKNVFEGGFLGLDNISIFDRSSPLPTGGHLEQADGTAWMALFCQNMMEISYELAIHDPIYEDDVVKFSEHFLWIAAAINRPQSDQGLWDEKDGFYYDLLCLPNGKSSPLKVRSIVGLLPMCATTVIEAYQREKIPGAVNSVWNRMRQMPEVLEVMHKTGPNHLGVAQRGIISLVSEERLRRILTVMLDESEFLSQYGIRSLSKFHSAHPLIENVEGQEYRVSYLPAESDSGLFGGNSNWRGPIWVPINTLIIRALLQYYLYYGDNFKIECPTGSGNMMNLFEVSRDISNRLTNIFAKDENGRRAVFGGVEKFQHDPHWRDNLLFYEYFHGDNGAGLGACHQTGWTALIARLILLYADLEPEDLLMKGKQGAFRAVADTLAVKH